MLRHLSGRLGLVLGQEGRLEHNVPQLLRNKSLVASLYGSN